jgi:hypothetical protein
MSDETCGLKAALYDKKFAFHKFCAIHQAANIEANMDIKSDVASGEKAKPTAAIEEKLRDLKQRTEDAVRFLELAPPRDIGACKETIFGKGLTAKWDDINAIAPRKLHCGFRTCARPDALKSFLLDFENL